MKKEEGGRECEQEEEQGETFPVSAGRLLVAVEPPGGPCGGARTGKGRGRHLVLYVMVVGLQAASSHQPPNNQKGFCTHS